jgi:hypothetical protein
MTVLLLMFFLLGCVEILRYTYMVWFKGNELIQSVTEGKLDSQECIRLSSYIKGSWKRLLILRASTLFIFLVSLAILIVFLWLLLNT